MVRCRVRSLLRNEAIIITNKKIEGFKQGDTFIGISTTYPKTYSFVFRLENIIENMTDSISNDDGIILEVDKRKIGVLADGDFVDIYPYNIPEPKKIKIAIPDKYVGIPQGDWNHTVSQFLNKKILDLGDEISLALSFDNKHIIVSGFIINSIPKPPVKVSLSTSVEVIKLPNSKIDNILKRIENEKSERAMYLKEYLEKDLNEVISKLKSGLLGKATKVLEFNNIKSIHLLDKSISAIFSGLECFDEIISEKNDKFTASHSYVIKKENVPLDIIEYQIFGDNNNGHIIIYVYSEILTRAEQLAEQYKNDLMTLKKGFQEKTRYIELTCNCGAKLDLDKMTAKGWVKCDYCKQKVLLPREYRY
ncbi:MAG: hypothetical protein ACTSVI_14730 [Promethearchaeota archaeon]